MKKFFNSLIAFSFSFLLVLISILLPFPLIAHADVNEAIFAGGCFWCLEHDFEDLTGVVDVKSGYTGGFIDDPSYQKVSAGSTGHKESIRVTFDPKKITYSDLLRSYWRNIDPFDREGQFCDKGDSYKPVIFTVNSSQALEAQQSLVNAADELLVPKRKIKVEIRDASTFWPAENYHQDYARNNNIKYNFYRYSCGRDRRLEEVWRLNARSDSSWSN